MTTTTSTTITSKLLCPECRRENEPERIYCHDCGARLDRTAVRVKKEPIQDTHKRVKRMFDPQRAKLKAYGLIISRLILGAGFAAVLVDMVLPPDVPAPSKNQVLVSSLRFDLESMATKRVPTRKEVTEQEANVFVASALKSKQLALDLPLLSFKRALVTFHEQRCAIITERAVSDYWPLYVTCIYAPELKDGHITAKVEGGRIGRLPIHPKLAQYMNVLLGDVFAAFDRDAKLLSKIGGWELHEKSVTLIAPTP
jgi:hypothetical protein